VIVWARYVFGVRRHRWLRERYHRRRRFSRQQSIPRGAVLLVNFIIAAGELEWAGIKDRCHHSCRPCVITDHAADEAESMNSLSLQCTTSPWSLR
jgi:predicted metal-binding membrane protein